MIRHVDPTRSQFDEFKALPRDKPIMMLNLIRLREQAVYPDGRVASGAEAYSSYGLASGPILKRLGVEIIWRGVMEGMVIGPTDKQWDIAFIARYAQANAFLAMVTDADYKIAVVHRQAAVDDSRLIRFGEAGLGEGFAG